MVSAGGEGGSRSGEPPGIKGTKKMLWHSDPLTNDLRQRGGLQVQHDGALLDAHFKLHQAVQRQRGHVRLAPALATLLHLLLELDPSGNYIII